MSNKNLQIVCGGSLCKNCTSYHDRKCYLVKWGYIMENTMAI